MKKSFFKRIKGGYILLLGLIAIVASAALAVEIESFKDHQNGKVKGFDKIDLATFKNHPSDSKFYTEVWFHELQFEKEGIIVTVSFQLHNLGLSKGYGAVVMTVSDHDSGLLSDWMQYDSPEVKVDEQGFGITVAKNRIELKGDTYRVKCQGEKIQMAFTYHIISPSFQQGDGTTRFKGSSDFVRYNFPIPWAEVEGTVTYNGQTHQLKGWASMNHDCQILSPLRYMSDWRALWMYTPENTVSIVRCSATDLGGQWVQRLMVGEKNRILFSSHDYTFQDLDLQPVPGTNVPCPRKFYLEAKAGDNWIKGEVKIMHLQEKEEILKNYPLIFRKLAEFIVKETWSYRFWCEFDLEFSMDGTVKNIRGVGTGNFVDSVKETKK